MKFHCNATSHIGRRKNNEDAHVVRADLGLAVVADGMGGYEGGEVASALVVDSLVEAFSRFRGGRAATPSTTLAAGAALQRLVGAGLRYAHQSIQQQRHGRLSRMGSTAAVVAWRGDRLVIGNVGDSRVYRFRDGRLARITRDHSMMEDAATAGLTPENIRALGYAHVLTRAVGTPGELEPDLYMRRLRLGDVLLLCSDGVWEPLEAEQLEEVMRRVPPEQVPKALVARAYAAGGADNMTALVLEVPRRADQGPTSDRG